MSSQAMEFDQENQGLVKREGSSGSKPSWVIPVPASVARIVSRQARASSTSPVRPWTASAMCQM